LARKETHIDDAPDMRQRELKRVFVVVQAFLAGINQLRHHQAGDGATDHPRTDNNCIIRLAYDSSSFMFKYIGLRPEFGRRMDFGRRQLLPDRGFSNQCRMAAFLCVKDRRSRKYITCMLMKQYMSKRNSTDERVVLKRCKTEFWPSFCCDKSHLPATGFQTGGRQRKQPPVKAMPFGKSCHLDFNS